MNKHKRITLLLLITILVVITFVGYRFYQPSSEIQVITESESRDCTDDSDCIVFGKDGDCNCGCFNKNYTNWQAKGACFCAAPTSCKCTTGKCEGVY